MSNPLGQSRLANSVPVWNGTAWETHTNDPTEHGKTNRQAIGWGASSNQLDLLQLTASSGGGTTGTVFVGGAYTGRDPWIIDSGAGFRSVFRYDWTSIGSDKQQTFTSTALGFGATNAPSTAAYDGRYVYVGCFSTGQVALIDASVEPANFGFTMTTTFSAIRQLIFDGKYMWAIRSTNVTRINQLGLAAPTTTNLAGGTTGYRGVFDGRHLWVIDLSTFLLRKIDVETVRVVFQVTLANRPRAITTDGAWIWIANDIASTVIRVHTITHQTETIAMSFAPTGIVFDGIGILVISGGASRRLNPTTGAILNVTAGDGGSNENPLQVDHGFINGATSSNRGLKPIQSTLLRQAGRMRNDFETHGYGPLKNGADVVQGGVEEFNFGTTSGTVILPARYLKNEVIILTGTLTGNLRVQPEFSAQYLRPISRFNVIENQATLGGNSLTFGVSSSNVSLGATGTFSMVWNVGLNSGTLTFRLANAYP